MRHRTIQVALAVLVAVACHSWTAFAVDGWTVKTDPARLVNGSPVLFRVAAPVPLRALRGRWSERDVEFRFNADCRCWYAIAGIDLNQKPGIYSLNLEGTAKKDGARVTFVVPLLVQHKIYPTTKLTVPPQYVEPPPEVRARIQEELAVKRQLFSQIASDTYWSGRFKAPVETTVSAIFGSARTLNGAKKTQHEGLDFHAAVGTTVKAANSGVVMLARNLYYEGNCVVVDHGQGLLTLYLHFSEIAVKEGDKVETGTVLGKTGATGRANGPHLHFAARWQGVYVDPATLLKLSSP